MLFKFLSFLFSPKKSKGKPQPWEVFLTWAFVLTVIGALF